MNKESFEKMDADFEKLFRPLKEEHVPDELFKNFELQVKRKILEQERPPISLGSWYAAVAVSLVTLAVIGILVWRMNIKSAEPVREPAVRTVLTQAPVSVDPAPRLSEKPVQIEGKDKNKGIESSSNLSKDTPAVPAPLEESDLITEIEALQELGVWTEEDDNAIGISAEYSLSELEMGLETENLALQSNPQISF